MKTLFVFLAGFLLFSFTSTENRQDGWGQWKVISQNYNGIEGRIKKGDYNEYARKHYWYFQFRSRYDKTVSFNYGYAPGGRSYDCKPDHFKKIAPGEVSDITGDLVGDPSSVHVCIGDVKFY